MGLVEGTSCFGYCADKAKRPPDLFAALSSRDTHAMAAVYLHADHQLLPEFVATCPAGRSGTRRSPGGLVGIDLFPWRDRRRTRRRITDRQVGSHADTGVLSDPFHHFAFRHRPATGLCIHGGAV